MWQFDPAGGPARWAFSTWDRFSSCPTCAGGAIYIGCDDGNLYSLSPTAGNLNWGVLVSGLRRLVISRRGRHWGGVRRRPRQDGLVHDRRSGHAPLVDEHSGSAEAKASPALSNDGKTVYFADDGGTVYALATSDGAVRWSHAGLGTASPARLPSSPGVGSDGTIYIGGADGSVYALNASDGSVKWSYATSDAVYSSPAIGADGTVYIGSSDGRVYALDGSSGGLKWSYATGAQVWSSPAIGADGTVYVGSEGGKLYAFGGGSAPSTCSLSTPATSGALKHTVAVTYSGKLTPERASPGDRDVPEEGRRQVEDGGVDAGHRQGNRRLDCKKKLAAGAYHVRASTPASTTFKEATSKWKAFVIK